MGLEAVVVVVTGVWPLLLFLIHYRMHTMKRINDTIIDLLKMKTFFLNFFRLKEISLQ
jgi:hypothetical protein